MQNLKLAACLVNKLLNIFYQNQCRKIQFITTSYFPSLDCPLKKVAGGLESCAWTRLKAFAKSKDISWLHEVNSAYLGAVSGVLGRGSTESKLRGMFEGLRQHAADSP